MAAPPARWFYSALRSPLRPLVLIVVFLFQSHWLDDVGSSDRDVAGIVVSTIGTALLASGVGRLRAAAGRIVLAAGLLFVAFVSVADLIGLTTDGMRAPDAVQHWRSALGWPIAAVVAATLVAAAGALAALITGRPIDCPESDVRGEKRMDK